MKTSIEINLIPPFIRRDFLYFICNFWELRYTDFVFERRKYTKEGNKPPKKKTRSNGSFFVIGTDGAIFSESDLSLSE